MTRMVQVAVAGDVTETEEIQDILSAAGIQSQLDAASEDDAFSILVPETSVEAAQDALEAMTEPDELVSDA